MTKFHVEGRPKFPLCTDTRKLGFSGKPHVVPLKEFRTHYRLNPDQCCEWCALKSNVKRRRRPHTIVTCTAVSYKNRLTHYLKQRAILASLCQAVQDRGFYRDRCGRIHTHNPLPYPLSRALEATRMADVDGIDAYLRQRFKRRVGRRNWLLRRTRILSKYIAQYLSNYDSQEFSTI